jgi:hypothetical protein
MFVVFVVLLSLCVGSSISPFRWNISDSGIAELKQRLIKTRLPQNNHENSDLSWHMGMSFDRARRIQMAWLNSDFADLAERCSKHAFQTTIDGVKVHFIRRKKNNNQKTKQMPALLLLHGKKRWTILIVSLNGEK